MLAFVCCAYRFYPYTAHPLSSPLMICSRSTPTKVWSQMGFRALHV